MDNPTANIADAQSRIVMLDVLRGIALSGILLLHHIEHFDFFMKPEFNPSWLASIDQSIFSHAFLFFSGKAFALFSLLFGFSYWIIYQNAQQRGERYLFTHLWRMALLAAFGLIHLFAFRGDILIFYAVIGTTLIFTRYMSNRFMLWFAIIMILNPIGLYSVFSAIFSSNSLDLRLPYPAVNYDQILAHGSFIDVVKANFTSGYEIAFVWTWNVGRFPTILGLFYLGAYLSKNKLFTQGSLRIWFRLLAFSLLSWFVLDVLNESVIRTIADANAKAGVVATVDTYIKLLMMFSALSLFIIICRQNVKLIKPSMLSDFGRMGLTNYIFMSFIGGFLYYGWGLGLHQYAGSTVTLLIGLFAWWLQMKFSSFWLSKHPHGPLEKIWRDATWYFSERKRV